jgi:small subunit ribosomal protein S20
VGKYSSARKRHRQSLVHNRRNRAVKSKIRSAVKDVAAATTAEARKEALRRTGSVVDRAAAKRVIHKNKAARIKSRLARRTRTSAASPSGS